ncbi:hypothetical protein [Nocardia sp. XZ_19_369]|uniref:hypothetical protein n=1 Tax=Nocardia sp. XZ_19_369 TaxID=2769487 RepID=UPI001E2B413A|nr:hypothetical protein [Nocardia sp. XZ_19_369]
MSITHRSEQPIQAVIFDWRGTLVSGLDPHGWTREALRRSGRERDDHATAALWQAIEMAAGRPDRLGGPHVDITAALHKDTYYAVFADAGLDTEIADALYAVESDPTYNPFAKRCRQVTAGQ